MANYEWGITLDFYQKAVGKARILLGFLHPKTRFNPSHIWIVGMDIGADDITIVFENTEARASVYHHVELTQKDILNPNLYQQWLDYAHEDAIKEQTFWSELKAKNATKESQAERDMYLKLKAKYGALD